MKDEKKPDFSLGALEKKGIRAGKGSAEWIDPALAMKNALALVQKAYKKAMAAKNK